MWLADMPAGGLGPGWQRSERPGRAEHSVEGERASDGLAHAELAEAEDLVGVRAHKVGFPIPEGPMAADVTDLRHTPHIHPKADCELFIFCAPPRLGEQQHDFVTSAFGV